MAEPPSGGWGRPPPPPPPPPPPKQMYMFLPYGIVSIFRYLIFSGGPRNPSGSPRTSTETCKGEVVISSGKFHLTVEFLPPEINKSALLREEHIFICHTLLKEAQNPHFYRTYAVPNPKLVITKRHAKQTMAFISNNLTKLRNNLRVLNGNRN